MEDIVLKRSMFAMPLKADTMNKGIMQGFKEDEEEDDYEEMSRAELTRRTPQSPEILMNNLRGDIRSVDARYEELAQMVGDEAAMDTPPEVLALLQGQMAQQPQQAGIGALPQAPQMQPQGQPAGIEQMMPQGQPAGIEQMMPQEPMPMDQGAGMMPQEPLPTDQGMPPPIQMADGGFVQSFANGSGPQGVTRLPFAFTAEQLAAMPGYDPTMPPDAQAIFNEPGLESVAPEAYFMGALKAGQLAGRGASSLSGYFRPSVRQLPNLGQGLQFQQVAPRGLRGLATDLAGKGRTVSRSLLDMISRNPVKTGAAGLLGAGLLTSSTMPPRGTETAPVAGGAGGAGAAPAVPEMDMTGIVPAEEAPATPTGTAAGMLSALTGEAPAEPEAKASTGLERTKKYASEYEKLFSEYLQGDKDAQRTQALLLLADAGLKLASTAKPGESLFSAIARSAEGVPAGLAKLSAQQTERNTAIKTAAIQAAIEKVSSEDAAVRDLQIQQLKSQQDLFKYMLGRGEFTNIEDLGAGLTRGVTKGGQVQFSQDPNTVAAAQRNPFTLNPATNPYAEIDPTYKPQVTTNKQTRADLEKDLMEVDGLLETLTRSSSNVAEAYGMPAAAVNFYNNTFVPLGASPNLRNAEAIQTLRQTLNQARPVLARIGGRTGRIAVQQEQWTDEILGDKPGSWFSSPQIAGKNLQILNTDLLNYRQRILGQLGLDDRVIRAKTPGLGIAEDPLIVPADPQKRLAFANMLSKQFAGLPETPLFLKTPGGETARFTVKSIIDTFGQQ
jgi:hypothetical protein